MLRARMGTRPILSARIPSGRDTRAPMLSVLKHHITMEKKKMVARHTSNCGRDGRSNLDNV